MTNKNLDEKEMQESILEVLEKMPVQPKTELDLEFEKYAKMYEDRFNKRAYIPESSGTKEFAIECIKRCLDEDKDMLDDLYFSNIEKDNVLY